jgi:hypothetical protein
MAKAENSGLVVCFCRNPTKTGLKNKGKTILDWI